MPQYIVKTAQRAIREGKHPSRSFGYVVEVVPPIETVKTGEDIEGIGWCPCSPTKVLQHFVAWTKRKARADEVAADYRTR